MSYIRTKMINGNGPYYYEVRSERDGDTVRQIHVQYLGTSAPVRGAGGEWVATSEIGAEPVVPNEEPRYRADADRVNESMNYGLASARFSTDAQDKLGRMTPKERAAVVEELRDKVDSGDMNDHVRYVNRHPEVLDAKPKPGDDVDSAEKSIALWKTSRFYPDERVVPKWNPTAAAPHDFPGREEGGHISKVQKVPLKLIVPTEEKTEPAQVARFVQQFKEAPSQVPPLVVSFSSESTDDYDKLDLLDGHHRLEAARQLGIKTVPVQVYVSPDDWESVRESGGLQVRVPEAERSA